MQLIDYLPKHINENVFQMRHKALRENLNSLALKDVLKPQVWQNTESGRDNKAMSKGGFELDKFQNWNKPKAIGELKFKKIVYKPLNDPKGSSGRMKSIGKQIKSQLNSLFNRQNPAIAKLKSYHGSLSKLSRTDSSGRSSLTKVKTSDVKTYKLSTLKAIAKTLLSVFG